MSDQLVNQPDLLNRLKELEAKVVNKTDSLTPPLLLHIFASAISDEDAKPELYRSWLFTKVGSRLYGLTVSFGVR